MEKLDFNKYENYIQVGHTATKSGGTYTSSDLEDFPTPSAIGYLLADVDKDAYTDLKGYTHRNRVRHDVVSLTLEYPVLSDDDLAYILNRISPQWFYVKVIDKKTRTHVIDNSTNKYWKMIGKLDGATYWYDSVNKIMYNNSYTAVTNYNFNDYTQVTTPTTKVHKMYASDKQFNSFKIWIDSNNNWHEEHITFSVTFVEE